jgi:hypothetical protein
MKTDSVHGTVDTLASKCVAIDGSVGRYRSVDSGCSIDRPAISVRTVGAVIPTAARRAGLVIGRAGRGGRGR